jgi:hypothetical protein
MKGKAGLFGLLLLQSALAGGCGAASVEPFDQIDRNHDGRISRSEAAEDPALSRRFAKLDADGDGELTPYEYLQSLAAANRL